MELMLTNEQVVVSHTHSVSSQSLCVVSTELTSVSESGYSEILDSDIAEHAVTVDTTSGSDVSHNVHSSNDIVTVPTVDKSFLR